MRYPRALLLLLLLATVITQAATPPALLHYQGVLRDDNDVPLDGTFDMVFRFFDAPIAGNEILVDSHTGGGAIAVSVGLFDATLGGGVVTDGADVVGMDPYSSLAEVFRDFSEVWMEIQIEGETLAPRVRILSAAYAQNASHLEGRSADEFIDTSATPQEKVSLLTVHGLDTFRNIRLRSEFFGNIYFADGGDPQAERFSWDIGDHVFEISAGLQTDGPLAIGDTASIPPGYNRISQTATADSGQVTNGEDLFLGDDLEADGDGYFGGGNLYVDHDGPDGDQHLWFWNDGSPKEELKWDEAADRFEFSDSLAIAGSLRTGNTQQDPLAYNQFGNLTNAPDSDDMSGAHDVYVQGDIEIESQLYLAGELIMMDIGPDLDGDGNPDDRDQWIFFYDNSTMDDEWFEWDNDAGGGVDRFELSDSLHVYGDLTSLSKSMVQNHPLREDLEIAYPSLEGNEATVFTRGAARLENGEARIALDETFGWVANPELGLSAHLTPRGEWSDLYVVSISSEELVVRSHGESTGNAAFDFVVFGLRVGYEDYPVVRQRTTDAALPAEGYWDAAYAVDPSLRGYSAKERHAKMQGRVYGMEPATTRTRQLRQAIGVGNPEEPLSPRRRHIEGDSEDKPAGLRTTVGPAGIVPAATSDVGSGSDGPTATALREGKDAFYAGSFRSSSDGVAGAYRVRGKVEVGDVVVIDPEEPGALRRADRGEDPTVVGIASADAGLVLRGDGLGRDVERVAVALSGIVVCKVDASYGAILPGDLLVTSPTPGHAMRGRDPLPGTVLGKALEALDEGTGTVRVLVMQR